MSWTDLLIFVVGAIIGAVIMCILIGARNVSREYDEELIRAIERARKNDVDLRDHGD